MSACEDDELCKELAACVEEVLDDLFPEDLAALLASYESRSMLRDDTVKRTRKVIKNLEKTTNPVRPPEYRLAVSASFSWHRNWAGIQQNNSHAVKKFLRHRRYAELPVGILVRTGRAIKDKERVDEDRVVALLAHSLRVRAGVTAARADQEPELILNMVVPAIVAALGPGPNQPPSSAADAALVGTALEVLDRGAELTAAYRVTRRGVNVNLPVAGNADFLVRIAAYRLVIEERRGRAVARPLDELDQAVADLSGILRRAMTRTPGRWNRRGPDEPDVATAISQYANYLGLARGDDTARAVGAVHSVLNYRLGLDEPPDVAVVDSLDTRADLSMSMGRLRHLPPLEEIEHLVGWLIAALLSGVDPDARGPALEWLDGNRVPNQSKNLPLLVRQLRVATSELDRAPDSRALRPAGVTPYQFEALIARLAAAVDPNEIKGHPQHDARHVTLSALPPLWTRRQPVILLVTAHLRVLLGQNHGGAPQATLVATHGVRAPVQFVQKSSQPLDQCCPEAANGGRPTPGGRARPPVDYQKICPHRPWGEVGWVENYFTLGKAIGNTPDATRQQIKRYKGPWPELLWH